MNNHILYSKLDLNHLPHQKITSITVHGRFQPPLHINHWTYIKPAFDIAQKVTILITNPFLDGATVKETDHRNKIENNPFSYEQRIQIFSKFFTQIGISDSRYEFKPFNITSEQEWEQVLDANVPNMINTYGPWSEAKLAKFKEKGFMVLHSNNPKEVDVSGTQIRQILNQPISAIQKQRELESIGYMPEAVQGLFEVLGIHK